MSKIKALFNSILSYPVLIFFWFLSYFVFHIINKVELINKEKIPHTTRVLYVSNHRTLIDSFLIGVSVVGFWEAIFHPKRIPWNAPDAQNFFTHKIWKHVFHLLKTIPVKRWSVSKEKIDKQITLFENALQNSNLVLFFEQTRSRNGKIGPCGPAVPLTLCRVKSVSVVPVFVDDGVASIMPIQAKIKSERIKRGKKGRIIIGDAINFKDINMSLENRKSIGACIREAVINLQDSLEK